MSGAGAGGMATGADVAIIGGGIIGTSLAAMLAAAGARVALFERTAIAAGASGRNAGELCRPPDPVLGPLFVESLERYRAILGEPLADGRTFAIQDEPIGVLHVSRNGDLVRRAAASLAAVQPDLPPVVLDGAALRAEEPHLADGLTAYLVATGYPVRPADATNAFAAVARRSGAVIRVGGAARPWLVDGVARGVEIDGGTFAADWVVVAAGPWTPELVDPTGAWRPVRATWGVIVEMAVPRPPTHVMGELMEDGSSMLSAPPASADPSLPAPVFGVNPAPISQDGRDSPMGLGGTLSPTEPDPVRVAPLLVEHARQYLPALDRSQMGATRVCARPQSFDGRPLIGLVPGYERLVVAAGNGAWGVSTGPATARLAADTVLAGSDAGVPAALLARRYEAPRPA